MKDSASLLHDMLDAISAIETYAVPTFEAFVEDGKTQDAIMFNLVILGEAANQLPADFRERTPQIPWSAVIGTRNVIVHGYDQVRLSIVWDILQKDLDDLKTKLSELV